MDVMWVQMLGFCCFFYLGGCGFQVLYDSFQDCCVFFYDLQWLVCWWFWFEYVMLFVLLVQIDFDFMLVLMIGLDLFEFYLLYLCELIEIVLQFKLVLILLMEVYLEVCLVVIQLYIQLDVDVIGYFWQDDDDVVLVDYIYDVWCDFVVMLFLWCKKCCLFCDYLCGLVMKVIECGILVELWMIYNVVVGLMIYLLFDVGCLVMYYLYWKLVQLMLGVMLLGKFMYVWFLNYDNDFGVIGVGYVLEVGDIDW